MSERILSLDVFRGLIIALMILVNSQLDTIGYPILLHAQWNGFTLADFVFPAFLFIVGLTTVVALNNHQAHSSKKEVYYDVAKRSIILLVIGLVLNSLPNHFNFASFRFAGVLQRIAICYFLVSFIYLTIGIRGQIILFFGILVGYWLLMTQIPVPGFGLNQLTAEGSWVAYVDQLCFAQNHLLEKIYDPEGVLSTVPALATTLMGLITGHLLQRFSNEKYRMLLLMSSIGGFSLLLGWGVNDFFPINKQLWSSSFVLWSGGWSLLVFAFCYWLIDILGYKKWALPFKIFGMNSLFAFVVHVLLIKFMFFIKLTTVNGQLLKVPDFVIYHYFITFSPHNAALFYSLFFLLFNFLLVAFLYKRKIFIRV